MVNVLNQICILFENDQYIKSLISQFYTYMSKLLKFYVYLLLQIIRGLENITEQIREVLAADKKVMKLAESLYQKKSLLVMGRGYNYATCLEGALVGFQLHHGIMFK